MLESRWYEGREQAFVKHTFLNAYMPAQIPKILRWANEFVYVELFAGPWQSKSGNYSDTSFGIALRCMTEAKAVQAGFGRNVKMSAYFVEKDPVKHRELVEAVKRFPEVETICHLGDAERHAPLIAQKIPVRAFRFVVIDPKGVPDVRRFRCLIEAERTEVLLNFMLQFANRFASSQDRMPTLEGWLGGLSTGGAWRSQIAGLKGTSRETEITNRARQVLRNMGGYRFAPAITVDEAAANRTLYKLIYLSRHQAGISVFRDAHLKALETQATYKSIRKANERRLATGMNDMFADSQVMEPGERSAREIANGERAAREMLSELLRQKPDGLEWKDLWPAILDECVVTISQLGAIVSDLRGLKAISIPDWKNERLKRPKDEFRVWAIGPQ